MPTLSWLTRDEDLKTAGRAPYRLLQEEPSLGYGDRDTGNMLIQGDNLEALKALLPFYAGRVKCIYIDPPYNTRSAFEHYDDNLEHSSWLAMMWPRLELLRELLAEDGSIWVSIDDNEGHYLKVIMDEVFGRANFVTSCTWQQRTTRENRKVFSEDCERILIYCRDPSRFAVARNDLDLTDAVRARYKNPDEDPRGPWQSVSLNAQGGHGTPSQFYEFVSPNGTVHKLPAGRCWLYTWPAMQQKIADNRVWFGSGGNGAPREKKFLSEARSGLTPNTLWLASEVGTNDTAKKDTVRLFGSSVFETPKPERLMERILHIATNAGDLVVDSFLGSGTTAAVAQKMSRRYIGIEVGDHAVTHCAPRLAKVVDGEQGGISQAVGWSGGGGFRFYRLGEPVFGDDGAITPDIAFATLAAHIWFAEAGAAPDRAPDGPLLGVKRVEDRPDLAVALLYNGVLGDKRPQGGNVLTRATLAIVRAALIRSTPDFKGRLVIYGERSALSAASLEAEGIDFKQTPYDVKARR